MIRHCKLAPLGIGLSTLAAVLMNTGCGSSTSNVRLMNAFTGQSSIDMSIASKSVASGVTYGAASAYVSATSGSNTLVVSATGSSSPLISQTISLSSGGYNTILATGSGAAVLGDNHSAPSSGQIQIRAVNASATLGTADVYIVAPGTDISTVNPTFSNLAYQSGSTYQSLSAGSYEVIFTQAGTKLGTIDSNSLSFSAGQIRSVVGLDGQNGGYTTAVLSDLD